MATAPSAKEEDESLVIEYKNPNFHKMRIPSRFQSKESSTARADNNNND